MINLLTYKHKKITDLQRQMIFTILDEYINNKGLLILMAEIHKLDECDIVYSYFIKNNIIGKTIFEFYDGFNRNHERVIKYILNKNNLLY